MTPEEPKIVLHIYAYVEQSRIDVVRAVQAHFFAAELRMLQQSKPVAATNSLRKRHKHGPLLFYAVILCLLFCGLSVLQ